MEYLLNNLPLAAGLLLQHARLTLLALLISLAIALPTGVLLARVRLLQPLVLGLLGLVYTIPSLALLVALIPIFGLGQTSALVALVIYGQFVLLRAWVLGLTTLDRSVLETASAMGMDARQRFFSVELPLALPFLLAGLRLASLTMIAIAAIAAYINAGGLGQLLFEGVQTANMQKILAGGLLISLFAAAVNGIFRAAERAAARRFQGGAHE